MRHDLAAIFVGIPSFVALTTFVWLLVREGLKKVVWW